MHFKKKSKEARTQKKIRKHALKKGGEGEEGREAHTQIAQALGQLTTSLDIT
jgi:hypothetical protein